MNPGKLVDPYKPDENLRLGADYRAVESETHFQFPEDHGRMNHAVLRCVGVGRLPARLDGGTMCPSYQVTREEEHSTRGRARLLFEMFEGEVPRRRGGTRRSRNRSTSAWRAKAAKAIVRLRSTWPRTRPSSCRTTTRAASRPMRAYTMGFIYWWARDGVQSARPGQCFRRDFR